MILLLYIVFGSLELEKSKPHFSESEFHSFMTEAITI